MQVGMTVADRFLITKALSDIGALPQRWLAQSTETNDLVVVTQLREVASIPWEELDTLSSRLQKLIHPNILRHRGIYQDPVGTLIVDELSSAAALDPLDRLPSDDQLPMILQVLEYAEGLGFTHDNFNLPWLYQSNDSALAIQYLGWPSSLLIDEAEPRQKTAARLFADWLVAEVSNPTLSDDPTFAVLHDLSAATQRLIRRAQHPGGARFSDLREALESESLAADVAHAQLSAEVFDPAPIDLTPTPTQPETAKPQVLSAPQKLLAVAFMALAGFVFFVLPDLAFEPTPTLPQPVVKTAPERSGENRAATPAAAAREKIAGEQAAEVAEQFIRKLIQLEDLGLALWDPESLASFNDQAVQADEFSRQADNSAALEQYQRLLTGVEALESRLPEIQRRYLQQANAALEQGDAEAARLPWEITARLYPDDPVIQSTWETVQQLPTITALIAEASRAQAVGEFVDAERQLSEASALLPDWPPVIIAEQQLRAAIEQNEYQGAMSEAFKQLSNRAFLQAANAFERALMLRPNDQAAADGLAQVIEAKQQSKVQQQLRVAQDAAAQGDWQQAIDGFTALLETAPGLVGVDNDLQQMQWRLALSEQLAALLNDPAVLQSDDQLTAAKKLILDINRLAPPFGDLKTQLPAATRAITNARRPLGLTINSDDKTLVTVLRLGPDGQLGRLRKQTLSLYPGRYVLTGSRPGFQDVRQEIHLQSGKADQKVTVICRDPI